MKMSLLLLQMKPVLLNDQNLLRFHVEEYLPVVKSVSTRRRGGSVISMTSVADTVDATSDERTMSALGKPSKTSTDVKAIRYALP